MEKIRTLREAAGLTQDEVCGRAGIARPNLSAYETGRRTPAPQTLSRIRAACRPRPSVALERHHEQVVDIVRAHHGLAVAVFGSVARGDDRWDSDLDLLVTLDNDAGHLDLGRMQAELEKLLNVRVDVVAKHSAMQATRVGLAILQEAKPLEGTHVS